MLVVVECQGKCNAQCTTKGKCWIHEMLCWELRLDVFVWLVIISTTFSYGLSAQLENSESVDSVCGTFSV